MALADTARLVASLELQDKFSKPIGNATAALGMAERRLGTFTGRIGYAGGQIGRLITSPLGLIGLTGGLLGVATAIGASDEASRKLALVQGQTASAIKSTGGSANVTAEQVRGLSQNLEDLTDIDDKQIQAGANLLLTFRNVRNEAGAGNDIFTQSVDILTDLATAMHTDVSGGAIQLGKALNDPIRGLTALRRIGVTFSAEQEKQIKAFAKSGDLMSAQKVILAELNKEFGGSAAASADATGHINRLNDAVEDLQIAFAEGLSPGLKDARAGLAGILKDPSVIRGARDLGHAIGSIFSRENLASARSIAGTLGDMFGAANRAWGALPDPLRNLLIAGLVGGKVTKFLFDFGPLDFLKGGLKLGGSLFNRGSTPAAPLFVADVGLGKGVAAPAATGGIGGVVKTTIIGAVAVAGLDVAIQSINDVRDRNLANQAQGLTPREAQLVEFAHASLADQTTLIKRWFAGQAPSQSEIDAALSKLNKTTAEQATASQLDELMRRNAAEHADDKASMAAWPRAIRPALDALHHDLLQAVSSLRHATTPAQIAAAAARAAASVTKGVGGAGTTAALLAELRKKREVILSSGDKAALHSIDRSIAKVEQRLPGREWAARQLGKAQDILHSSEGNKAKLADLSRLASQSYHQSPRLSAAVQARINALKADLHATTARTAQNAATTAAEVRRKKLVAINNVSLNVSTVVSTRDVVRSVNISRRYGLTAGGV